MGLHQYKIHSDKPFQCKLCGEKGNGASQYSNHMRKHKEPKSIQFEICQYESTDASNMKKHNIFAIYGMVDGLAGKTYFVQKKTPKTPRLGGKESGFPDFGGTSMPNFWH